MTPPLRLCVHGAAGHVGRLIVRLAAEDPALRVTATVVRPGGEPGAGPGGTTLVAEGASRADVLIDFSRPEATAAAVAAAAAAGIGAVVGTTGLGPDALAAIDAAAARVPVVVAPNTSVGVALLVSLVERAAAALGPAFDPELVELHHRRKRDAPSGTALALAAALAAATGRKLDRDLVTGRQGDVGARRPEALGVLAVRGGDVVGEHTIYFLGEGERLELTHRATSRELFARGALRAARWVAGRAPGRYGMRDVLDLA